MASAKIFTSLDGSSLHVKILGQVRTPHSPTPSSVAHTKSSARIRCPRGSSHRTGFTVVLLCRTKDRNGATSADAPDLGTTHFPSRTSAGSLCALPGELLQHTRCVSCLVANRKGRGGDGSIRVKQGFPVNRARELINLILLLSAMPDRLRMNSV
ncbi:hypothetical protein V8C44DRAFT_328149 [Trichoderma aethiopicum]